MVANREKRGPVRQKRARGEFGGMVNRRGQEAEETARSYSAHCWRVWKDRPRRQRRTGQDLDRRHRRGLEGAARQHRQPAFIHHHVAAMPDVHLGIGATIGSVIATHQAIIPAAVGVDIGCGMVAARLSLTANDIDEKRLKRCSIRSAATCRSAATSMRTAGCWSMRCALRAGPQGLTERHPQLLKAFGRFSQVGEPDGHARRRQPLHRVCLDEHERRLGDAALGQPGHRQRHRDVLHRAGARRTWRAT